MPRIVHPTMWRACKVLATEPQRFRQTHLGLQLVDQGKQVFDVEMGRAKWRGDRVTLALPLELSPVVIPITGPRALPGVIALLEVLTGLSKRQSLIHLRLSEGGELCAKRADP